MNPIGLNVPNAITLARLLCAPLVIWLILGDRYGTAFGVFVAAGVSDGLDGFIAKRFDMRTRLGALLDPIADKTLLVSVFVALGMEAKLPDWLVILVVFRDVMIIGGYMLIQVTAAARQFDPLYISKINTAMQIVLVSFVLAKLGIGFSDGPVTPILVWAVAATTVLSGGSYFVRWARILSGAEPAL
ncbi:MAG TPA: CDP-alcohol phosphatidyltransferase family protein [Stellaceae bacterium]|jgi:cardiolipin synthase